MDQRTSAEINEPQPLSGVFWGFLALSGVKVFTHPTAIIRRSQHSHIPPLPSMRERSPQVWPDHPVPDQSRAISTKVDQSRPNSTKLDLFYTRMNSDDQDPVVELPPSASAFPESADPAVETDSSPMNPPIHQPKSIDSSVPAVGLPAATASSLVSPLLELRFSSVLQPLCAIVSAP
jgi:hypothetical protein